VNSISVTFVNLYIQFKPPLCDLTFLCDIIILSISDGHDNISGVKDNNGRVNLPYHKILSNQRKTNNIRGRYNVTLN
jgi:hypothetical protein